MLNQNRKQSFSPSKKTTLHEKYELCIWAIHQFKFFFYTLSEDLYDNELNMILLYILQYNFIGLYS